MKMQGEAILRFLFDILSLSNGKKESESKVEIEIKEKHVPTPFFSKMLKVSTTSSNNSGTICVSK